MRETPRKNHRRQDILLYEQNLLEDGERRELEEHLRGCPECQATQVTVKRFLPLLHEALEPNELPAEELLRRVKAQMREQKPAPAPLFTRLRVALASFALASASAIFFVLQTVFGPQGPRAVMAKGEDAGPESEVLASPRRPELVDGGKDAGIENDGGGPR